MFITALPQRKSISVEPKRKGKGRGRKGGVRRGRKGATAASTRKLTSIPIVKEKEGELH